jgi:uncharacterized protein (DUF885 family)
MKIIALALLLSQAPSQDWIEKSNHYTNLLLDVDKKYNPEQASAEGLAEYDTKISVPTLTNSEAERKETEAVLATLKAAAKTETDKNVAEDLSILIKSTEQELRASEYARDNLVPDMNPARFVYGGVRPLLDDQSVEARRPAAVIRLKEYAGQAEGFRAITDLMQQRIEQQMARPNVVYPSRQRLETELSRNAVIVSGIGDMFRKYHLTGWEDSYATLQGKMTAYDAWIRANVLPKARTDFREPPKQYALALEGVGIDIPPAQLAEMAHLAFTDMQAQMKDIAAKIAEQRHLPSSDYRDVMKALKKDQITGDAIMPLYEGRLKQVEEIIREHHLVTLPDRPCIIRLASAAETAQSPAPHMVPPPLLHNTGQRGEFVLPLNMPGSNGKAAETYDDFTFDAAAWTLIAHEARPGHELQFDSMVEHGVSLARALFAFNSTNVEGWGLYSESIVLPYMPLEGQLVSIDYRLLRAARAFLDPELQAGKITPEQAMTVLTRDVVQSNAMARQEVERYTIQMPGQANSYFYGYTKLIALRAETQALLGNKFNAMHFHDFLLSQGLLPPDLMRKAVLEEFVPSQR